MNDRDVDDTDDGKNGSHAVGFVSFVERAAQCEIAQKQKQQQGFEHDAWIAPLPVSSPRGPSPHGSREQRAKREPRADRRRADRYGMREFQAPDVTDARG